MVQTTWAYLATLLLCAGLFPFLETRLDWRIFKLLPAIVLTYLGVTGLAMLGFWQFNPELALVQKNLLAWLLPALMFLLLVDCDLRAIIALGPRILLGFVCATVSILVGFYLAFQLLKTQLPSDAWQTLAALSGGWIGGTANLVAVSQAVAASPQAMANALLTDSFCYSIWVLLLFAAVPLQQMFNRHLRATPLLQLLPDAPAASAQPQRIDAGNILLWLGMALLAGKAANLLAGRMPELPIFGASVWTLLFATLLGLLAGQTPLRRIAGAMPISGGLLAVVVAALASGASYEGLANAPYFILAGLLILLVHGLLMLLAARLFGFDLALCGIASLANIGGVASAPLLAAAYSPRLAPVGILLAMLGYLIGTGAGIGLAWLLRIST